MKITRSIGRGLKSLVNFPRWMGLTNLKSTAGEIKNLAKFVFTPDKAKHQETFEQAVKRLNLSEKDIKHQTTRHLLLSSFYGSIALVLLAYSVYLLTMRYYQGFILGVLVSVLTGSFAFREHFYYFQMKKRKLGCTLQDWADFVLRRAKK